MWSWLNLGSGVKDFSQEQARGIVKKRTYPELCKSNHCKKKTTAGSPSLPLKLYRGALECRSCYLCPLACKVPGTVHTYPLRWCVLLSLAVFFFFSRTFLRPHGRCAPRRPRASPCQREQSQERQGAAADPPANLHAEDDAACSFTVRLLYVFFFPPCRL